MLNKTILLGRLTSDPDLKQTNSGVSVATFTVAVERNYKSGDAKLTDFIPCNAWRSTADFVAKYFHKGDMIAVDGTLQSDKYTDKDGNNRTSYRVIAENVSFCGGKKETDSHGTATVSNDPMIAVSDDDLPF